MARLNWTLWLFAAIIGVISSDITNGNSSLATYQRMMKLRHLAVEFFDFYENVTVTDLKPRIPTEQDLLCAAEVQQLGQALQSGSLWALRMIDSWGGLPSGLLHGNLKNLGNFDECIRIQHEMTTTGHLLRGKYCSAKLPVGSVLGGNSPALSSLSAQTAVCFPASCSAENIDALLSQLLQRLLNIEVNTQLIKEANCQTAEKEPLDGLAIFTIVLLSILAGLMLLTTIWDYFFCHDQKRLPAVVQIFSARVNSRALFRFSDSKSNPNVIDCLHGIRGLSLMWVIYGHDYLMAAVSPNINLVDIVPWFKSPYSMFTIHALFSVDTFFFLSGLLIVLVALRTMEKTRGKLNVPLMYLHRFLRLTPVLALGILGYMAILPVIGGGPVYNTIILAQKANCEESWFWTLLYVQNYVAAETMCLGHSWYLGVDTQLYVISPLLLLALYKWGKKAVAGIVVFMLLLAACLFSMMMVRGYTLQLMVDSNKIYYTTHTRASPWIIGLLFGYFLHVNRGKSFKLKPLAVWAGWISSLALIFACLFGIYPYAANGYELPKLNEAFYVTLTRIAWPIALIWVVFACKYGYGGLANSFLSSPLWQPLSKLSYCAYIWHFFILELNGFSTRTSTYFSDYQVMLRFWPDFGFTVLLAYVMYILVEAPTGGIQTLLLPSGRPKASPPKADAPTIEPRVNEGDTQVAPPVALKTPLDG